MRRSSNGSATHAGFNSRKIPLPMAGRQGCDAVYMLVYRLFGTRDGEFTGPAPKAALENRKRTHHGVTATDEQPFSRQGKDATIQGMPVMGVVKNGAVTFACASDTRRNLFGQREQ